MLYSIELRGRFILRIWAANISQNQHNRKARMVIANDITEKIKAEEDLRQSEMRLKEAQAIAHISNWGIDLTQNLHTWADEFYNIFMG